VPRDAPPPPRAHGGDASHEPQSLPQCDCPPTAERGNCMAEKTCGRGKNAGRRFLSCPNFPQNPCKFFKWVD